MLADPALGLLSKTAGFDLRNWGTAVKRVKSTVKLFGTGKEF